MTIPPQRSANPASMSSGQRACLSSGDSRLPHGLEDVRWAHMTRTFQALGHRFAVGSTDAGIGRLLDELYEPCVVPGEADTWYWIYQLKPGAQMRHIFVNRDCPVSYDRESWVLRYLTWHVNHEVIQRSSDYVLLHAAAAERHGLGVVFPAPPEAGKTTLVAGLIRSGFRYVTDEAVAIDPSTLDVIPYPKPLSIDPGSWSVLPDFAPTGVKIGAGYHESQWHVNPQVIREDAISGSVGLALVVFPKFVEGARTFVEPVRPSEALVEVLGQTFRLHEHGRRNFGVLGRCIQKMPCYRLVSGDLEEACLAVEELVNSVGANGTRR